MAGAIGKLPDGLRPPPRARRREIPLRRKGRGGSVSRRDHHLAARTRAQLTGGSNSEEAVNSNASRSSGEGGLGKRGKTAIAASGG